MQQDIFLLLISHEAQPVMMLMAKSIKLLVCLNQKKNSDSVLNASSSSVHCSVWIVYALCTLFYFESDNVKRGDYVDKCFCKGICTPVQCTEDEAR